RGSVRIFIVDTAVAVDLVRGFRLAVCYSYLSGGRFVIGVAVEGPGGRSTGDIRKAVAEVEQAAQSLALDARGRTRGSVRIAIVRSEERRVGEEGIRLGEGDRYRSSGTIVIGG